MFSGIEAASAAWHPLGWKPLAFAEIEKFPSAVLAHHWPGVPNLGDMTKVDWSQFAGKIDVVIGGPPCQAFSVAGLRESLEDARGILSLEYIKAVHAIRPRFVITENVPGWLSTKDNAFGCFLAGMVGADSPLVSPLERGRWTDAGVVTGPLGVATWRVLNAQYFGVAQRRRRVFVVADFGNGAVAASVLFERKSGAGDFTPRGETREGLAPSLAARTRGGGGLGTDAECDGALIPEIAGCLQERDTKGADSDTKGADSDTKPGHLIPEIAPTLMSGSTSKRAHGKKNGTDRELLIPEVAHTLKGDGADASEDGTGRGTPLVPVAIGIDGCSGTLWSNRGSGFRSDGSNVEAVAITGSRVRRLTPKECERLQGFPDNHTLIPWRGKPAEQCPDGPRYKAIGNSMAVPVIRWLGERLEKAAKENDPA